MKYIFISGLNGFIGKHLANFFSGMNYQVYGLSRDLKVFLYNSQSSFSNKIVDIKEIKFDGKSAYFINSCSIEFNNKELLNFYNVNFFHSLKLLNFCSDNKINHFINLATTLDPLSGPYANSKNLFSSQLSYFSDFLELKALNLFLEPVFGSGMKLPRLIPYIFKSCASKETATINSSKDLLRYFIYIEDFLEAINMLINSSNFAESDLYIIGQKKYTIKQVVDEIINVTNSKIGTKYLDENLTDYNFQTSEKVKLFQDIFPWRPKTSLREGLEKIIKNEPYKLS
jgi:nucleoside-diphosphate-sugar epimerase